MIHFRMKIDNVFEPNALEFKTDQTTLELNARHLILQVHHDRFLLNVAQNLSIKTFNDIGWTFPTFDLTIVCDTLILDDRFYMPQPVKEVMIKVGRGELTCDDDTLVSSSFSCTEVSSRSIELRRVDNRK
jgi:hypothetical protein